MRRLVALVIGLASLATASCAGRSDAQRPQVPGQQWEYRIVRMDESVERDLTSYFNTQAAEGWEYVGQLTGKDEHLVFRRLPAGWPARGMRFATAMAMPGGRRGITMKRTTAPAPSEDRP